MKNKHRTKSYTLLKNTLFIISYAICIFLINSCSKESKGTENAGKIAVQFSEAAITRVSNNAWEANDTIGIYMISKGITLEYAYLHALADNTSYTIDAELTGKFTPSIAEEIIYFPDDDGAVDFYAYYPYQSQMTNGKCMIDVSDQTDLSAIDLLTAKVANKTKLEPQVSFQFEHKLTKLKLTAQAGVGMTAADLEELSVTISGVSAKAEYNIETSTHIIVGELAKITPPMNGLTAEAILIPTSNTSEMKVHFHLKGGVQMDWEIATATLESGKEYSYTIKINKTTVELISQNITAWGNGESGTGSGEEIKPTPTPNPGGEADILYWDGHKLQVGKWGEGVTQSNMVFTKFGSVIGFFNIGYDGTIFNLSKICFNPLSDPKSITEYGTSSESVAIPYIPCYSQADWNANLKNVSATTYHNASNIENGKGDICKLVGLTLKEIKEGKIDNGKWRLPTDQENALFAGSQEKYTPGIGQWDATKKGMYFPKDQISGNFLPATGHCSNYGSTFFIDKNGYFWSSIPYTAYRAYFHSFGSGGINPCNIEDFAFGFAIRCITQ